MPRTNSFWKGQISSRWLGAHHIGLHWQIVVEEYAYSVADTRPPSYARSAVEAAMDYAKKRLHDLCSARYVVESRDLITQSTFDAELYLSNLPVGVTLNASAVFQSLTRTQVKRVTWEVPIRIGLHGSTATIIRTRELSFYGLSLSSGTDWQRLPLKYSPLNKVLLPLPPSAATSSDSSIGTGDHPF